VRRSFGRATTRIGLGTPRRVLLIAGQ
jgi:hypothetical protein